MKKLSTGKMVGIAVIAVVLLILFSVVGTYNGLVSKDETVSEKWANVQSAYQRRADLIPNLVDTVQAAVKFEQGTQTSIAAVRTSAVAAQQAVASAKTPAELSAASQKVESAVAGYSALNINVENYPNLKATENFLSLQDELAGTENRVKVERDIYNSAVKSYNVQVRTFPSNLIAGWFGFATHDSFEAQAGSENAPKNLFQ